MDFACRSRKKRVGEYGNRVEAVKLDGLFHVYGACGRIGDGMNDNENGAKPFGRRRPLTALNSSWMSCGFSNRAARCKPLKYNQLQANTILSTKRKGLFAFLYENHRLHEGRERDEHPGWDIMVTDSGHGESSPYPALTSCCFHDNSPTSLGRITSGLAKVD